MVAELQHGDRCKKVRLDQGHKMYISRRLLNAKKGYLQLLTLTTTLTAVRNMANLVPRAFPLKVGGAGKSPGNEVEKWPEIKETT